MPSPAHDGHDDRLDLPPTTRESETEKGGVEWVLRPSPRSAASSLASVPSGLPAGSVLFTYYCRILFHFLFTACLVEFWQR